MKKKLFGALIIAFMLAVLGLYVWELTTTGESDNLITLIAVEVSMTAALFRLFKGGRSGRRSASFYEQRYAKETLRAFEGRNQERKRLFNVARLYNEQKYDKALDILRELKRDCRNTYDKQAVMLFTALCYSDSGNSSAAEEEYEKLLLENPENGYALGNLGVLCIENGQNARAEELYQKMIALDPNDPLGYHNLASLYYRVHEYERAVELAKKALEKKQNFYQAAALLSILCALLGRSEDSCQYFKLAVANGQNAQNLRFTIDRRLTEQREVRRFAKELSGRRQDFDGDIIITDPCYIAKNSEEWDSCKYGQDLSAIQIRSFITFEHGDSVGTTLINTDTDEIIGEFASDSGMVSVMLLSEVEAHYPQALKTIAPSCYTIIRNFQGTISASSIPDNDDQYWKLTGEGNINFESAPD